MSDLTESAPSRARELEGDGQYAAAEYILQLVAALVAAEGRIEKAREAIGTENAWDGHARADQLDAVRAALSVPVDEGTE